MTDDQLDAIADAFNDLFRLLRDADPRDKAELYSRIGLRLIYQPRRTIFVSLIGGR